MRFLWTLAVVLIVTTVVIGILILGGWAVVMAILHLWGPLIV